MPRAVISQTMARSADISFLNPFHVRRTPFKVFLPLALATGSRLKKSLREQMVEEMQQ